MAVLCFSYQSLSRSHVKEVPSYSYIGGVVVVVASSIVCVCVCVCVCAYMRVHVYVFVKKSFKLLGGSWPTSLPNLTILI